VPEVSRVARVEIGGSPVTVARLAQDQALVLTPAATREAVVATIAGEVASGNACCHLTDLTSTLAGLSLVGPRCRDVLRKLTSADLRDRVVPNASCAQVGLARVPALILRRDLAGLPSYEVYVARDYGEYVWDAVFEAGHEFGLALIGRQAWRMLSEEA